MFVIKSLPFYKIAYLKGICVCVQLFPPFFMFEFLHLWVRIDHRGYAGAAGPHMATLFSIRKNGNWN